jgi:hypothetical protein
MIVVGILLGRDSRFHTTFLTVTGIIYLSDSLLYALNPGAAWAVIFTYLALIPYLGMLLWILGRFLAAAQTITRDVLYAAVAIYLLMGGDFRPCLRAAGCPPARLFPRRHIPQCRGAVAAAHLFFVHHPDIIWLRRHFARVVVGAFTGQPGDDRGRVFHHHRHVAAGIVIFRKQKRGSMKITIIGAGNIGRTLGSKWAQVDHQVTYGVRNPADPNTRG